MKVKIEIEFDITKYVESNELTFPEAENNIREAIEDSDFLYEFGYYLKAFDTETIKININ